MNSRRVLGLGLLITLLALAGCSSVLGPSAVSQTSLTQNQTYDWNTNVNASINVTGANYEAVYKVHNRSSFVVRSTDSLGRDQPLSVSALQFRYPNGRVVTAASPALNATNYQKRTVISLPARNGELAFTGPAQGKQFSTQTFVKGSYALTIPKGMRVAYQPLARISPAASSVDRTPSNHVRIHWRNVETDSISVRYYLGRDLLIFAAGFVVLVLVGLVGALYYLRQIRELEARRRDTSP